MNRANGIYQGLLLVGIILAGYSIAANVILYRSFADETFNQIMLQVLAVGFDAGKFLLLPAAAYMWRNGEAVLSAAAVLAWMVLTALSVTAGFGYLATIQDAKEQQLKTTSTLYESAREEKQSAAAAVSRHSRHSTVNAAALEARNLELKSLIQGNLSHRFYNDANPVNKRRLDAEIQTWRAELTANQEKINGYGDYQSALNRQQAAALEWRAVNQGGGITESIPAIWRYLAVMLPWTAATLRAGFVAVSSLGAEFFATLFLLLYAVNKRRASILDMPLYQVQALQRELSQVPLALSHQEEQPVNFRLPHHPTNSPQ